MRLAAALAVLAFPSVVLAGPLSGGITFGETQSKVDAQASANHTVGVFGRLRFSPRVSGQLELQRVETDSQQTDIRSATGLLVVELGSGKHFVPLILAGFGLDHETTQYGYTQSATHTEGGFGLEYRADGGLTIGADVRLGGRSLDGSEDQPQILEGGGIALYQPSSLHAGEYRSARVTVGIRF